jgi:GrpB-like predicted nucleotidyltransferase (UPF0157 family)
VLALLSDRDTEAASTLRHVGISRDVFVRQLEWEEGPSQADSIPLTPRAQMIVVLAASEADALDTMRIGPTEILLGVMRESESWRDLGKAGPHHLRRATDAVGTPFEEIRSLLRSGLRTKRPRPPEANTVVTYDPDWPHQFETIRRHLTPALVGIAAWIEHVGSTAVPGLLAKPIIDIDVVVREAADVPQAVERLEAIGYLHRGDLGVQGREALSETGAGPFTLAYHHLYVVVEGTKAHEDHVGFRDYLRAHPERAAAYGARKVEVAHLITAESRDEYVEAKSLSVEQVLQRVRAADSNS